MASLRRSTATNDRPTARFLYAILRQLDTRTTDWDEVAENVELTNGHAARMRYSRFKQHMEGGTIGEPRRTSEPRERRQKKKIQRKQKQRKQLATGDHKAEIKSESFDGEVAETTSQCDEVYIKPEPETVTDDRIKAEPAEQQLEDSIEEPELAVMRAEFLELCQEVDYGLNDYLF